MEIWFILNASLFSGDLKCGTVLGKECLCDQSAIKPWLFEYTSLLCSISSFIVTVWFHWNCGSCVTTLRKDSCKCLISPKFMSCAFSPCWSWVFSFSVITTKATICWVLWIFLADQQTSGYLWRLQLRCPFRIVCHSLDKENWRWSGGIDNP